MAEVGSILRESVEQSLKDLLGEEGAESTFFHIGLGDYDTQTHEFHTRMFQIFKAGTPVLERMIIKDLYKRLNIQFQDAPDLDYEESMKRALKVVHERVKAARRSPY